MSKVEIKFYIDASNGTRNLSCSKCDKANKEIHWSIPSLGKADLIHLRGWHFREGYSAGSRNTQKLSLLDKQGCLSKEIEFQYELEKDYGKKETGYFDALQYSPPSDDNPIPRLSYVLIEEGTSQTVAEKPVSWLSFTDFGHDKCSTALLKIFETTNKELSVTKTKLTKSDSELSVTKTKLTKSDSELSVTKTKLTKSESDHAATKKELSVTKTKLTKSDSELSITKAKLTKSKSELSETKTKLTKSECTNEELSEHIAKIRAALHDHENSTLEGAELLIHTHLGTLDQLNKSPAQVLPSVFIQEVERAVLPQVAQIQREEEIAFQQLQRRIFKGESLQLLTSFHGPTLLKEASCEAFQIKKMQNQSLICAQESTQRRVLIGEHLHLLVAFYYSARLEGTLIEEEADRQKMLQDQAVEWSAIKAEEDGSVAAAKREADLAKREVKQLQLELRQQKEESLAEKQKVEQLQSEISNVQAEKESMRDQIYNDVLKMIVGTPKIDPALAQQRIAVAMKTASTRGTSCPTHTTSSWADAKEALGDENEDTGCDGDE